MIDCRRDNFKKFLNDSIQKLKKQLFLEYTYKKPKIYPIRYKTGLNVYNREFSIKNSTDSLKNSTDSLKKPDSSFEDGKKKKKFDPIRTRKHQEEIYRKFKNKSKKLFSNQIKRIQDGSYIYLPTKKKYRTIFDCFIDLKNCFQFTDIFQAFSWQEFEDFIKEALNIYGYNSFRTFRYTIQKKRYEVDVLAKNLNKILFIDTKRWNPATANIVSLSKAAEKQLKRAVELSNDRKVLKQLLKKLGVKSKLYGSSYKIFPIILVSSEIGKNVIKNGIPIVSFLQFNEFLNNFDKIQAQLNYIGMKKKRHKKK